MSKTVNEDQERYFKKSPEIEQAWKDYDFARTCADMNWRSYLDWSRRRKEAWEKYQKLVLEAFPDLAYAPLIDREKII